MNENRRTIILGIETSCDETSAAVVENGTTVLSNVISSQMDIHRKFGGVVPEVASRRHVERITLIIEKALHDAKVSMEEVDGIAVTQGPGLVGALLIGVAAAKALSFATGKPLIPVHHIAGHIYANHLVQPLSFPLVALVVSGGHTELIYMERTQSVSAFGKNKG
jgi:N6-L-threonylcarbamoyladenine synthase